MNDTQKLKDVLTHHGSKLTRGRARVYEVLQAADRPLSNQQLIALLPDIDRVSVYRTIDLFESVGIAHRIWNGFKSAVELSETFSTHHHHFSCTACRTVISFKNDAIEQALHDAATNLSLSVTGHVVELQGLCGQCSSQKTDS